MNAILSVLTGMISFILIAGAQMSLLAQIKMHPANDLTPAVYSIGWSLKIVVLILGIVAIVSSILYKRTPEKKLGIINMFGMILGVLAIVLCFFPLYQMVSL